MINFFLTLLLFLFSIFSFAQTAKGTDISTDHTFDKGSSVSVQKLSGTQIRDLAVLGKVWGFLKYYHPKANSGTLNWDYELFKVMPGILSAKNESERNKILLTWTASLGDFSKRTDVKENSEVRYKPDLQWISKSLGKDLSESLMNISRAERKPENHYVKIYSEDMPIPYFQNEAAYAQFKYPDAGFRLLSLYRYWNMIEYFYPYKNTLEKSWDKTLIELIPKFAEAENEMSYKLAVASMVAEIQDSHAILSIWTTPPLYEQYGKMRPAVNLVFVGNRPVVSESLEEKNGNKNELLQGDEIVSVNQKAVETLLKEQLPYASGSNEPVRLSKVAVSLLRTNDPQIEVGVKRSGTLKTIKVTTLPLEKSLIEENQGEPAFKMVENDIAYIHPGRLDVKDLDGIMQKAIKAKAIIIDMRTYPKETMFLMKIGDYLFDKPKDFCRMTKGNVVTPGQFSYLSNEYMSNVKIGKDTPDYYKGKLIVLCNETTQSFAEMSLMAFRAGPNTTIIGSQTAGADGNVTATISLPGNIKTIFTGIGMYNLDGTETQRIGIVPDIEVKPTVQGILDKKDEVLERAIRFSNGA
ncbi:MULTISPECIES: S41 family peptidase [Chryseobacterium]|uniref:S41 family peptidase n=1 Tax=Chryseobacterium TaxID=59732 RepID=UPI0012969112|nr:MULTISPECIES: S41 family peptidase [Chryseobacterium]MDR6920670.1 C-terminal processing protease CtpA/Prc [Chryseobacterium sp. 2987]